MPEEKEKKHQRDGSGRTPSLVWNMCVGASTTNAVTPTPPSCNFTGATKEGAKRRHNMQQEAGKKGEWDVN